MMKVVGENSPLKSWLSRLVIRPKQPIFPHDGFGAARIKNVSKFMPADRKPVLVKRTFLGWGGVGWGNLGGACKRSLYFVHYPLLRCRDLWDRCSDDVSFFSRFSNHQISTPMSTVSGPAGSLSTNGIYPNLSPELLCFCERGKDLSNWIWMDLGLTVRRCNLTRFFNRSTNLFLFCKKMVNCSEKIETKLSHLSLPDWENPWILKGISVVPNGLLTTQQLALDDIIRYMSQLLFSRTS